jgi:hypothetical protein
MLWHEDSLLHRHGQDMLLVYCKKPDYFKLSLVRHLHLKPPLRQSFYRIIHYFHMLFEF